MQPIKPRLVGGTAIVIGTAEVTPAASHLFALLLALTLSPHASWTRRGLQQLIFGRVDGGRGAHRLRQLLYRLRSFGLVLDEDSSGVVSVRNPIADLLADAVAVDAPGPAADGGILPLYAPPLPETYLEWLDERRGELARRLTAARASALRSARERQDWLGALRLASALQAADPHDEGWAQAAAECHAMLGRRDEAIDTIDRFVRESESDLSTWPALKRLRARITTTRVPRRDGTLRGRTECLAFLADQWEMACGGGGGRACAILGAAGMGKTRVGEAFAAVARLGGAQVLHHRCDSQSRHFPLSLFARVVPDLRQRRGSIGADPALAGALDRIAASGETATPDLLNIEDRREELKRAIVDLLDAVGSEQPLLLVVDDAHLLDDPSRAVIHALVEGANGAQVMVMLLCRPRVDGHGLLTPSPRFASYSLPPLSDEDSRSLVLELTPEQRPSLAEVEKTVRQAGGNPFYLNALARHPCDAEELPVHIRSLAQTVYLSVSADARTLLDASLLLDTLASTARVIEVASVDANVLIRALRELEESDLLQCEAGHFIGPHAILREAIDALMPTTTRTVLHRRIAKGLAAECDSGAQIHAVAWAAVASWLAAGEADAAVQLALRLARNTAILGEPEAGALLLSRLSHSRLSVSAQREVLDEIIRLAEAGLCEPLLARAVAERTAIAISTDEGPDALAELTLRSVTLDLDAGRVCDVRALDRIVGNSLVSAALRAAALARVLAIADLRLDRELAEEAFTRSSHLDYLLHPREPVLLRTHLIYHTVFGDIQRVPHLIARLLAQFIEPSLEEECMKSRMYCFLSLLKIGWYHECVALAKLEWEFMNRVGHLFAAEYAGAIAIEALVADGNARDARNLLMALEQARAGRPHAGSMHIPVYYSSVIALAMIDEDFDTAWTNLPRLTALTVTLALPRLKTVELALRLRVRQARQDTRQSVSELGELETLFLAGRGLGGLDLAAEVLWHAYTLNGQAERATSMLAEYLAERRELGRPEASLQRSTANDPAWRTYQHTDEAADRLNFVIAG